MLPTMARQQTTTSIRVNLAWSSTFYSIEPIYQVRYLTQAYNFSTQIRHILESQFATIFCLY